MNRLAVQRDAKSAEFFDAAAGGRLAMRRCLECHQTLPPEAVVCTTCASTDLVWADAVGTGVLASWTTVHRAPNPFYAEMVPYVVGIVELDEGPWLYGLIDAEPRAGLRVRATFPEVADGETYPVFSEESR
jgi:uncharacterized OB-fold protein